MMQINALVFLLLLANAALAQKALPLGSKAEVDVVSHLREYADCTRNLSAADAFTLLRDGAFTKTSSSRVINRGVTPCFYWFALTVENTASTEASYLWTFYNDGISFSLYEMDTGSGRVVNEQTTAHRAALSEREVQVRMPNFRMELKPHETKTFLLKTELHGRQNLYFPTSIDAENEILAHEIQFSFLLGRYYGFFIFATLFNLFLFLILRKRFYGVMVGYIATLLAFNLVEYLHDVYFFPPLCYLFWSHIPKLVYLGLIVYFNVQVFQYFTVNRQFFPRLNRYLAYWNWVLLAATVGFLLLHVLVADNAAYLHTVQLAFVALLLSQVLLLVVNIACSVYRKTPYIFHYLIGNSVFIASALLYTINALNLGDIPRLVAPGNTIFAFAFEIVYLMIAFTVKYKRDFDRFSREIAQGEVKRKRLTAELVVVQEKERQRIGQDIHDGLGGTLNSLRLMLEKENLQAGEAIRAVLTNANSEFRTLIHHIAPRNLETQGLFKSIGADLERYGLAKPAFTCEFLGDENKLPLDMKINVFRVYQELLNNIIKHATGATKVFISIAVDNEQLTLMVEDDGPGLHGGAKPIAGMGMSNIRSRVDYYDGDFQLDSSPDGVVAIICLPLPVVRRLES